ncbi:DUF2190 family protein [Caenispirillum bisanense]|uniref:DUF2190 family protein n=1 Tax=Caenispirillum bisanense TaxID=414052 RepID=UPI0031DB7451
MKNFVQPGNTLSVIAPTGGVTSGAGVLIGNLFGIAAASATEGTSVSLTTVGVFDLPKLGTDTIDQGQRVYWDAANAHITEASTGNYPVGIASEAAGNGTTSVRVRLDGISTAPAA